MTYAGYRQCASCGQMAYCKGKTYDHQYCARCASNPRRARAAEAPHVKVNGTAPDPAAIAQDFEELAAATGLAISRITRIVRLERREGTNEWPALRKAVEVMEKRHGCKVSTLSRVARARRST